MKRFIGRIVVCAAVLLAVSLLTTQTAQAHHRWWVGYPGYVAAYPAPYAAYYGPSVYVGWPAPVRVYRPTVIVPAPVVVPSPVYVPAAPAVVPAYPTYYGW